MEGIIIQLDHQGRLQRGSGISLESSKMSRSSPSRESGGKTFCVNGAAETMFDSIMFFVLFTLRTRRSMRNN